MFFESEYASVEWNEDVQVAVLTWKKFAFGDAFRAPCRKALELAVSKGAKKWYSDTTLLGVLRQEDTEWFMGEIVTGMLDHGIEKQALIVPVSVIAKMSLSKAGGKADDMGLETKFFDNTADALTWLKE